MSRNTWDGIYSSFEEVPISGKGFDSETWLENSRKRIYSILETPKHNGAVPLMETCRESLLPLLAAIVSEELKTVRILDFGGGLGSDFVSVIKSISNGESVEYYVVESEKMCDLGNVVFSNDTRIQFRPSLPDDIKTADIVHLGSSLHYISDWQQMIQRLASYNPRFFIFTDLPVGNFHTYASAQNYYGSKIPCWFFNFREFVEQMRSVGFHLTFKSSYVYRRMNVDVEYRQDNFPEEYRLGQSSTLLFCAETA